MPKTNIVLQLVVFYHFLELGIDWVLLEEEAITIHEQEVGGY